MSKIEFTDAQVRKLSKNKWIKNVKGIGDSKFNKLKDKIVVK